MRRYIYVDTEGLQEFDDQAGSPKVREKVAKLTVQFGATPISGTQDQVLRDPTDHERIERVLEVIGKEGLLEPGRLAGREAFNHAEPGFRLETCRARNIFLPRANAEDLVCKDDFLAEELFGQPRMRPAAGFVSPVPPADPMRRVAEKAWRRKVDEVRTELASFPGIGLWWSDRLAAGGGHLFLIPNFRRNKSVGFAASSAYTALTALFADMGPELRKTVLFSVHGADVQSNMPSSLHESFLRNPAAWFQSFGARLGPEREITTLYDVREAVLYRDIETGTEQIATVAYPIFIAAGGGETPH